MFEDLICKKCGKSIVPPCIVMNDNTTIIDSGRDVCFCKRMKKKIYAVDLDGTLNTHDEYIKYDEEEYMNAKPRLDIIDKINRLKLAGHTIIIHTARSCMFYDITKRWLDKYNVFYDRIITGKEFANIYVDDRAIRPEELK